MGEVITQQAGLGFIGWIIVSIAAFFIIDQLKGKKKKDEKKDSKEE